MSIFVALSNALYSFFGFFATWFARNIGLKMAMTAAIVAAYLAMIVGLNSAFNLALGAIGHTMPPEFQWSLGIVPTNAPICLSTIVIARVTLYAAQVKWAVIQLRGRTF